MDLAQDRYYWKALVKAVGHGASYLLSVHHRNHSTRRFEIGTTVVAAHYGPMNTKTGKIITESKH